MKWEIRGHPRVPFNVSWACGLTDSHFSSNQPHQTLFLFKQIISGDFGGTNSASPLPPAFQVKEVSTQHLGLLRAHPVPALGGSWATLLNNGISRHTQQTLLKDIPKTCVLGDCHLPPGTKSEETAHLRRSLAETNTAEGRMRKPTHTLGADMAFPKAHDLTLFLVTYANKSPFGLKLSSSSTFLTWNHLCMWNV